MSTVPRGAARALALAALLVAACSTAPATLPPSAAPTPGAAAASPTAAATRVALVVDRALASVLPATVGGITLVELPEGEAELLASTEAAKLGLGVYAAVAVDGASDDFVLVQVIRLQPGVLDATKFRDWRSTFDAGVCANAGGVGGTAEVQLGGRAVEIGSCRAGVFSYHAWIADEDLLISASSAGDRRFGELLMKGLTP